MKTHFTLLKSSLMVLFLCLGLSSWGQTTVISQFSDFGFTNAETLPSGNLDGNISFTTEQNDSGTVPTYYTSGGIRFYPGGGNGGSITLHVENDIIVNSVKFFSSQTQPVLYSIDGGVNLPLAASSTYEITNINASSTIEFINGNTNSSGSGNQLRLTGVEVTYTMATSCEPSDLTFANTEEIADLADGNTFTQTATSLNATTAITYESSDEAVATVNANTGEVTLVSVGTAIITATQEAGEDNGTDYCAGTVTYELTVITTEPLLTVSTNSVSFTGFAGGASVTEDITVEGLNLTGDIALVLSGDTNFSINPTSLSSTGGEVTITYTPSATPATHSATLTVSNGSLSEVITLSGVTNEMPAIGCFEENFDGITAGNSTSSSGSNSSWAGNDNFPTVVTAYQAGGAVRLGSSNNNGSITSVPLTEYAGQNVTVSFSSKAWGTASTSILVSFGTQSQVVSLPAASNWSNGLSDYEIAFENIEANAELKFESNSTSERRFFIDNIAVCLDVPSTDPALSVSESEITDLNYGEGNGPSASQSFVLSGENLDGSEDVTLLADTGFEISLDDTSFDNELVLTDYEGENTTIYVRLASGLALGAHSGVILIDGYGAEEEVSISGSVLAVPVVTEASDLTAQVDVAYSYQIIASDEPFSYVISSEALPAGLSLDTETGFISGTPTVAGEFIFGVEATNNIGTSEEGVFVLTVAKGVQTVDGLENVDAYLGDADITLPTITDQGFTLVYEVEPNAVASISGNTISFTGLGSIDFIAYTEDGDANYEDYTEVFTVTVTEAPELYAGNGVFERITSIADLTDGYYVFAYNNNAMNTTLSSGKFGEATIDSAGGFVVNPDESVVWKIETIDGGKTIWNDEIEKFINYSNSTNFTLVDNTTGDNFKWNISDDSGNFLITSVASPNRGIIHRSTGVFGAYSTGNIGGTEYNTLQLFKLVESTTWDGLAWSNGDPDNTKVTVLDAPIIVGAAGMTKALIVTENGGITIPSGTSVTVQGAVVNHGDFTVEAGGNLIQLDDVENTGAITVEVKAMTEWFGYNMFSSPVAGQTFADFSSNNGNEVYTYDYANPDGWVSASGGFVEGEGYLFAAPYTGFPQGQLTEFTGEFVGVPQNGNVSIPVVYSFTALGNPYPSAIDAKDFLAANSNVGTLYFWTNAHFYNSAAGTYAGNNYATFTSLAGAGTAGFPMSNNLTIEAGQGFLASVDAGNVVFNNTMRVGTSNGQFYKTMEQEKHILWLNLANENNMLNQIAIGYADGATEGVDTQIDGKMFGYAGSALYSIITGEEDAYAIQGRSLPFTNTDAVALGFRAVQAGTYTVSLADFNGLFADGQDIYLKDNATQTYHDLKDGAYTFVSEQGVFESRFEVVYQADGELSTNVPTLDNSWIVYSQDNGFQIEAQGFELKEVAVYDMLGRLIYSNQAAGTSHAISNIANGVLIVKVITTDNQVLTRKTAK